MPAVIICLILLSIIIFSSIYNSLEHKKYNKESLRIDALPIDIKTEEVGLKGEHKFRTTVIFEDEYKYISHDTERENHFSTYTITLTESMKKDIVERAIKEHNALCEKHKVTKTMADNEASHKDSIEKFVATIYKRYADKGKITQGEKTTIVNYFSDYSDSIYKNCKNGNYEITACSDNSPCGYLIYDSYAKRIIDFVFNTFDKQSITINSDNITAYLINCKSNIKNNSKIMKGDKTIPENVKAAAKEMKIVNEELLKGKIQLMDYGKLKYEISQKYNVDINSL